MIRAPMGVVMKAVIYSRFSIDRQSDSSIADHHPQS